MGHSRWCRCRTQYIRGKAVWSWCFPGRQPGKDVVELLQRGDEDAVDLLKVEDGYVAAAVGVEIVLLGGGRAGRLLGLGNIKGRGD